MVAVWLQMCSRVLYQWDIFGETQKYTLELKRSLDWSIGWKYRNWEKNYSVALHVKSLNAVITASSEATLKTTNSTVIVLPSYDWCHLGMNVGEAMRFAGRCLHFAILKGTARMWREAEHFPEESVKSAIQNRMVKSRHSETRYVRHCRSQKGWRNNRTNQWHVRKDVHAWHLSGNIRVAWSKSPVTRQCRSEAT